MLPTQIQTAKKLKKIQLYAKKEIPKIIRDIKILVASQILNL